MCSVMTLSLIGSAAYLLRGAEKSEFLSLGQWSLTTQFVALGSSIVTSTIGTFTGLKALENKVNELQAVKCQSVKIKLEKERNLIVLKLAADVSICAWAIFELANLTAVAVISPPILTGALVVCCAFLTGSMVYEFQLWGGWQKLQQKVDVLVLPVKARIQRAYET